MVQHPDNLTVHTPSTARGPLLIAATCMYLGLSVVCASAIYTAWQPGIVTTAHWFVNALIGLFLLTTGWLLPLRIARHALSRFTLALGAVIIFSLAYDPQLSALPQFGEELPESLVMSQLSVAGPGVFVFFFAWLAWKNSGGELELGNAPFRQATFTTLILLILAGVFMYLLLHQPHDLLPGETLRPVLAVLQACGLVFPLLGCVGGVGIRRWPFIITGLTLLLALVRNLLFPVAQ